MRKISYILAVLATIGLLSTFVHAGPWTPEMRDNSSVGATTVTGELVCLGCTLKKLSGSNAQCGLFTGHDIGLKLKDGTLWSFVNNAKGHDVIYAHELLNHKQATVTGHLFPAAHMIEIESIQVEGVSADQIAKSAWEEDQIIAKMISSRKVGEFPTVKHTH